MIKSQFYIYNVFRTSESFPPPNLGHIYHIADEILTQQKFFKKTDRNFSSVQNYQTVIKFEKIGRNFKISEKCSKIC